jgi:protein-S-isoprenylcysteine O-methyltransferase Ste14
MALREEMEAQGQWLFRWRSYIPVALLVVLGAALVGFRYPRDVRRQQDMWEAVCLLVSAFGVVIRAMVVGYTPAGTSGRNTGDGQVAASLNTAGLYAFVRHPLYLGNFLMWLGIAMLPRSWWAIVVICLAFWLYYERIMLAEEAFLRKQFGERYDEWARHTPPFFPSFSAIANKKWVAPLLPFSLRNVLKREYSGVFAVVLLCGIVDAAAAWIVTGRPIPGPVATGALIAGAAVYVILRTLKRHTHILNVTGR